MCIIWQIIFPTTAEIRPDFLKKNRRMMEDKDLQSCIVVDVIMSICHDC